MNPELIPLEVFGIYDRGVPNLERIVLRASQGVKLRLYALVLGIRGAEENMFPVADNFLWLGDMKLDSPGWIFVYTGRGSPSVGQETHTKEPIHSMYWNKSTTILEHPEVIPALVRFDFIQLGNKANKDVKRLLEKPADKKEFDWAEFAKLFPQVSSTDKKEFDWEEFSKLISPPPKKP